jgi:hypothetical protein
LSRDRAGKHRRKQLNGLVGIHDIMDAVLKRGL